MNKLIVLSIVAGIIITVGVVLYILTHVTLFHRITIGGTEYSPGSNGRTFVQILRNGFDPVNNAVCKVTILYPDNTYFAYDSLMQPLGTDGLYYYDFIAPETEGVYMLSIRCEYPNNLTTYYASGVKVEIGETINHLYETYLLDGTCYEIYPKNREIEAIFNFTEVSSDTGELDVVFIGNMRRYEEDVINMYAYDFCNNNWKLLPNKINYYHPVVANTINDNVSCFIQDNTVSIKFEGSVLNPFQRLCIDELKLEGYTPSSQYITELRGGGEIHVEMKKTVSIPSNETPEVSIIS